MAQAVILAGGKGTRLASRLNGKPKLLVDVDGVPLLKRQIDNLIANGVDDIVLLVNHAADQIETFIAEQNFSCTVTLIDDGDPRGTAGAALACLDRDGTLNKLTDYVRKPEDLVLFEGVGAAVRRLNDAEYRVVIVTDQPVLARGECAVEGLAQIHAKLESELGNAGAFLDAIYHPHRGYADEVPELKIDCACRKPGKLMIEQAVAALNRDLERSWMVGDSTADMAMARKAGIRSALVGEGGRDGTWPGEPDVTVGTLVDAIDIILMGHESAGKPAISETMQP